MIGGRQTIVLPKGICLQLQVLVYYSLPFATLHVISVLVEQFGGASPIVFAGEVENACGFLCLLFSELLRTEVAGMVCNMAYGILLGIPSHVHKLTDGIFHRLEVAHVQNPKPVDSIFIGKCELFPWVLYRRGVDELGVAGSAYVIDMIIQPPSTLMLALLGIGNSAHVAPVVVAE